MKPKRRRQGMSEQAEAFDYSALRAKALSEQLGVPAGVQADLVRYVTEDPLPLDIIDRLVAYGWQQSEVFAAVIPRRTYALRKSKGQKRLTAEESDRAIRAARVVAQAEYAFGDRQKALAWLRKPKWFLGERTPMSLLGLSEPARLIEQKLLQLEHGMAA
jgi:putative toxin-antitoxin system antitoxin component (TIGR02293 family)